MGSSHSASNSSSIDELNNNNARSSSSQSSIKSKKSTATVRLFNKIRRQSSSSRESIARQQKLCQHFVAIDPIPTFQQNAQDQFVGEFATFQDGTADEEIDQITIILRDDKSTTPTPTSCEGEEVEKPVSHEDRHNIQSTTCEGDVERESTKQNTDKVVSCNSTATAGRSQQRILFQTSDKSELHDNFETETYQLQRWEEQYPTKNEKSSVNNRHLQIVKLESLELLPSLQQCNESLNTVNSNENINEDNKMPIVKKNGENSQENGCGGGGVDKGIFSVSRVKKVELSEISLASDICTTPSSTDQPTMTSSTPNQHSFNASGNGSVCSSVMKNGSGSVLHRVITLTTADSNLSSSRTLSKPPIPPTFIPEKLHFSAYEKFEGQMLVNWFLQSLQTVSNALTTNLSESDHNVLAYQFCNSLLTAGVIRKLDETSTESGFKSNIFYQWVKGDTQMNAQPIPGKIDTATAWPPSVANDKKQSPKGESKIPKLLSSSTPNKARIQLISNLVVLNEPLTPIETPENRRLKEMKSKVGKCENIPEMLQIVRNFLNEHTMQSSESSTNSGIFTNSMLNGTESTVYDRSMETTVFNILQHVQKTPPKSQTPPRSRTSTTKSRTTPSTPTGSSSRLISSRRNLSVDSVNSPLSTNGSRNSQSSPAKNRRMVDKATVMDVDPLDEQPTTKQPEMISIEIQTDPIEIKNETENENEEKCASQSIIPPPPPPMMMMIPSAPIPPPPPPLNFGPPVPPGPPAPPAPPIPSNSSGPPPPSMPMPFPPTIQSANSAPGKVLSHQNASNLSSVAANDDKPKPLPFPASEFYSTNTLRKKAVNPPKSMKPLYWTRIVAPIKPQDCVDAEKVSEEEREKSDEEELWKEIDETKLDNLDEFAELFSRQGIVPKVKTTALVPKIKTIKVLDSKRSQNVGIFVRSIHVDFSEIEHAIYHCDTSVVSLETLQHIMEIRATTEELLLIKDAVAVAQEDSSQVAPGLDAPENFLLRISQISSSAERISCIVFQAEFDEQCTMVSRKLMTLKSICEHLIEHEGLKEVFSIILTLGNFMNGGNRQRGQADGFGLEILGKLKDVKSKEPKITLLHFIVKTFIDRCRKNGVPIQELVAPVPNPNDVEKMLSIDFDECRQQLNLLKTKVEECRKTTEKVVKASPEDAVQPFKHKMEEFLEMAIKKIDSRFQKLDECHIVFVKTLKFYKFLPRKVTLEETPPQQFFEYWTTFCSDFNDIFKKELLALTKDLMKKTRQVTKPQSKPTSGENNLKARINRLKNRNN